MRVGIIGAGISGLAAARMLTRAGHEVVVWERHSHVGGRIETIEIDGYVFDTGATSIAPRGLSIEEVMLHELDTEGLVQIDKPIYTHEALRVVPGDPGRHTPRYTYVHGNRTLPERVAADLDVRIGVQIEEIARSGHCFIVGDDAFDAVILTAPIPQTSVLLWGLRESRPVANAKYRSCLSVMLGFRIPTPEVSYHALLDVEQRHPLTWLCLESGKSPGRAPEGCCAIVAQMNSAYSQMQYEKPDREIIDDVLIYVQRLYGPEFTDPSVASVRRWKYSQPETVAQFDVVNQHHARLLLAGDGLLAGRVESAFESGVKAARLLIER
ncbi:MAG TPA: FAD-dependent oxidoreductase [Fimbriimonadaceae bacterium]|nr:FAD-dependent oxidoreductase [Fimbriimonadaceae bacterium]